MYLPEHLRRYDFAQEYACGEPVRMILRSCTSALTCISGYGCRNFRRLVRDFTPVVMHNKAIAREKGHLSVIAQSVTNLSHTELAAKLQKVFHNQFCKNQQLRDSLTRNNADGGVQQIQVDEAAECLTRQKYLTVDRCCCSVAAQQL